RLHDAAGADGDLLLPDRCGEPDHRPDLRDDRSQGEGMSATAEPAPAPAAAAGVQLSPLRRALQRFLSNPTTGIGIVLCVLVVIGAVFAPYLSPHDPIDQNII